MKKILFLAPAKNYHTKKWCTYFFSQGFTVHIISLTQGVIPNVCVHSLLSIDKSEKSDFSKLEYLFLIKKINRLYQEINPDIVSVHYASSYGLLAALSKIKKYSLSVWGTDVYAFPKKSFLHREIIKYSLNKATLLLSTSRAMAIECKHYTNKNFYITPFGVDMKLFSPKCINDMSDVFIISTIKSLSPEYGIDVLLKAIRVVLDKCDKISLRVNIAGQGSSYDELIRLAKTLNIEHVINWMGLISQEDVIFTLNNSHIAVLPSYRESFGVSAVEAQACGIPVIISDVEGLKEATNPGITSIVFSAGDYRGLAEAIIELYYDKDKRFRMGYEARRFVLDNYEYMKCFKYIEHILSNL